jgi:sulfur-carrier protein
MRLQILYFAAVRDLLGMEEEFVMVPDSVTCIAEFSTWIEAARPALAGRMASVRIAKNHAFVRNDEALADGDVLAVLPPVSGG